MSVTAESMLAWCRRLVGADSDSSQLDLEDYLSAIPRLASLGDLPAGTPVLIRGDVDAKPGSQIGEGDIRLRSMLETLKFGRESGWKQVIFGHIGRKPEGSLEKVAGRLGQLLESDVPLITDWLDEKTLSIADHAAEKIASLPNGGVAVLENTRRYDIERVLWKAKPDDLPPLAEKLAQIASQFRERVAKVYINEALSAGSLDASSTVVPAAMDHAVLGSYVAREFEGPMKRCREAELVVFSGLKADKLDDMEAMISRGRIRWVFTAGSLAMALKKAAAELDGSEFCMGVAEHPEHADKPYFIPRERIDQAKRMITSGREQGIQFVLPVDFVLQDGRVAESMEPNDQQFDVGPKTSDHFEEKIGQFLEQGGTSDRAAFYNGVFGMFEDARFEGGTKRFVSQLKRLHDAGVAVFVGGGEGGKALDKYGQPDWVTHVFTAGGTVLNALGGEPIPYLVALKMAAEQ